jgi:hypothetical protein
MLSDASSARWAGALVGPFVMAARIEDRAHFQAGCGGNQQHGCGIGRGDPVAIVQKVGFVGADPSAIRTFDQINRRSDNLVQSHRVAGLEIQFEIFVQVFGRFQNDGSGTCDERKRQFNTVAPCVKVRGNKAIRDCVQEILKL